MQACLRGRIAQERMEIDRLKQKVALATAAAGAIAKAAPERCDSPSEAERSAMKQLVKENQLLEVKENK